MRKFLLCVFIFLSIFCSNSFAMNFPFENGLWEVSLPGYNQKKNNGWVRGVDPPLIIGRMDKNCVLYNFKNVINDFLKACHGKEDETDLIEEPIETLARSVPVNYQMLIEKTGNSDLKITLLVYATSPKIGGGEKYTGVGTCECFSSKTQRVNQKKFNGFLEYDNRLKGLLEKADYWHVSEDKTVVFAFYEDV